MKRNLISTTAIALSLGLAACSGHGMQTTPVQPDAQGTSLIKPMDVTGGIGPSLFNLLLGDAKPNLNGKTLQHLNIGIREIDVVSNGASTMLAKYDTPRVVDVLAHQNDTGEQVARSGAGMQTYQQVRFVVDVASSQALFGRNDTRQLNFLTSTSTFSSVQAGANTVTTADGPGAVDITVTQPFSIPNGSNPDVRVDFNAYESIAMLQDGSIAALPALFISPMSDIASIGGRVLNAQGKPVQNATVVAVASDGSIGNTTFTDDRGRFRVGTLRSGTYRLMIYNQYTTASGQHVSADGATSNAQAITGPTVTATGSGTTTAAGTLAD